MRLVLEFFLGNTFPSVVFLSYGAHFLTFGATFQPFYAAISSYTIDGSQTQTQTPAFMASFSFYACFMSVLSFVYLICSIRTNAVFVVIFVGATFGFVLAAGAFWSLAEGHMIGAKLLVGTGGAFFVAAMMGWYLLAAIMFAVMDLPIRLPVVDLSTVVNGRSQMDKERQA
jgi:succinate-acetate transporter protein